MIICECFLSQLTMIFHFFSGIQKYQHHTGALSVISSVTPGWLSIESITVSSYFQSFAVSVQSPRNPSQWLVSEA